MKDAEIRATLTKLMKEVEGLNAKVSQMPQVQIQVSTRLLPTLLALQKIESGTATQVSLITHRCRAFESKNLNELHLLGILSKEIKGHERIFEVKDPLYP
ncbi:MAG: hypothetical protein ACQCN6_11700 [Candidatus Bathyarchaeia archaeon]|jgi:hypothetical protein